MRKIFSIVSIASMVSVVSMISLSFVSCSDFFETESNQVIFADQEHLNNATDTIYSLTGILNKLQAIADRTVLLGEARGDLVDITKTTSSDLRDVALFQVGESNKYNVPRDYYAIINNCNYYIANADTALKNNRNEYIFRAEFAAVKAIRAWTYLQLVTTYGEVPFVLDPILTKEESEKSYPTYNIQQVCEYFINQDGLQSLVDQEYPIYGNIKSLPSRLFYIPMYLILGDLQLWYASYTNDKNDYYRAAEYYYNYLNTRNGSNSAYPTELNKCQWQSNSWNMMSSTLSSELSDLSNNSNSEVITIIPGDSIPSEGYYSELRNIFNTSSDNDYAASLVPAQPLIDLSAAQTYCFYNGSSFEYAQKGLSDYKDGDLRLIAYWQTDDNSITPQGEKYTQQNIRKYSDRNIRIYRRQLVYLRLAEALNCAGYPLTAYRILQYGLTNSVMKSDISSFYMLGYDEADADTQAQMRADSTKLARFNFNELRYIIYDPSNLRQNANTQGIHSRGSGFTPASVYYTINGDPTITLTDTTAAAVYEYYMKYIASCYYDVEQKIIDEEALEFAFEGYRFYDLMRFAIRNNDPSVLANRVNKRSEASTVGKITVDLLDQRNWFLPLNK